MDMFKKDGRVIVRPDGRGIEEGFISELEKGGTACVNAGGFIRIEHPHCAFFKSLHNAGGKEYKRTTLLTPEGRLHIDRQTDNAEEPESGRYVTKKEHLEILLFFLRDVEVKPSLTKLDEKAVCLEMPQTPMTEFFSLVEKELFLSVMSEYEIEAKHILNQLRRIYNEKIDILFERLGGGVEYALFEDMPDIGINEDLLERWHFYYIRKTRLLKQ